MKFFWNDKDGLSSKDYLLLISSTVFFGFVFIGLVLVLLDKPIDNMYLQLLDMVSPVIMTICGGVFGVQAVEKFRSPSPKPEEEVDYEQRV
jgi:hypothetical protein